MKLDKRYAYRVVRSTVGSVIVGTVLLYKTGHGRTHCEFVINTKTFKDVGSFSMEKIGPCWVVDGKVQFEKPPEKSGELTRKLMRGTT